MDTDFRKECENSNIKFSIIVPVYNVEKFLRESLDSIVAQTFKDFEVICVNDGSTDNSLDILEEYAKNDSRIKIISQENQGQGIARNKAIDIAQGRYLLFVDPDDWIETNALEQYIIHFYEICTICSIPNGETKISKHSFFKDVPIKKSFFL